MAKSSAMVMGCYVGGRDVSGDVGAIEDIGSPRAVDEVPSIDQAAMQRLILRGDAHAAFTGYFDDAAGKLHEGLSALPTANVVALIALGNAVGSQAALLTSKQVDYPITKNNDGSVRVRTELMGNGVTLAWGEMLTALSDTIASSGSEASKDDGSSSSNGLEAVLQVIDIGSGTPTVVIEDSADDAAWATLISFTAVADGAEPTAERKTVSGTVDRYIRITVTGTFTNLVLAVGYRRGTSQDDVAYA